MIGLKPLVLGLCATVGTVAATTSPSKAPMPEPAPFHCQVPCGIYGDMMRISMILEDCATIEKAMAQIQELSKADHTAQNNNQLVRWVTNKESHAQNIQDQVAAYWLSQRIKSPKDASDAAARKKYLHQLELLHGITVAAMKCKQTVDASFSKAIRDKAHALSESYFSKEDLEHLKGHHK